MRPGEEIPDRPYRDSAIFPFVSQNAEGRGEQNVIAKLVDEDFAEDDRDRRDIA
jgi:hypothetical protein